MGTVFVKIPFDKVAFPCIVNFSGLLNITSTLCFKILANSIYILAGTTKLDEAGITNTVSKA